MQSLAGQPAGDQRGDTGDRQLGERRLPSESGDHHQRQPDDQTGDARQSTGERVRHQAGSGDHDDDHERCRGPHRRAPDARKPGHHFATLGKRCATDDQHDDHQERQCVGPAAGELVGQDRPLVPGEQTLADPDPDTPGDRQPVRTEPSDHRRRETGHHEEDHRWWCHRVDDRDQQHTGDAGQARADHPVRRSDDRRRHTHARRHECVLRRGGRRKPELGLAAADPRQDRTDSCGDRDDDDPVVRQRQRIAERHISSGRRSGSSSSGSRCRTTTAHPAGRPRTRRASRSLAPGSLRSVQRITSTCTAKPMAVAAATATAADGPAAQPHSLLARTNNTAATNASAPWARLSTPEPR